MVFLGLIFSAHEGWQSNSSILVHPRDGKCRNREVAEPRRVAGWYLTGLKGRFGCVIRILLAEAATDI